MKLIDKTKLEAFGATCKSQDYMDGVKDVLEYIDSLPPVDAIPIEWIEEYTRILAKERDKCVFKKYDWKCWEYKINTLTDLIDDWKEEQEKADNKKSYFPKGFFSKERPLAKGEEDETD